MKFRNRGAINALGFLASGVVRGLLGTVRFDYQPLGDHLTPTSPGLKQRYIFAFWHEYMLIPAYHYARPDVHVLISQSDDGQIISEACRHLGFSVVRGSSSRGGAEAVRQLVRLAPFGHLGVTPDGPRGPRRKIQSGVIYLASRTGLPIVAAGFGVKSAWRAKSWDRFCLPKPFTRATCVTAAPLVVPADAEGRDLVRYRQRLERDLLHVTELAERWAETGRRPVPAAAGGRGQDAQAEAA
jgi:lysophospholipid acyltransferase (LPLAT)-like uncharacterized protein